MASCVICRREPPAIGAICEVCAGELWDDDHTSPPIAPEQLIGRTGATTRAALVDRFGQLHVLGHANVIGRAVEQGGLAIVEGSVSRAHAALELVGSWRLRDLGSANGTFVDGELVTEPREVRHGQQLRFGKVALVFVDAVAPGEARRSSHKTLPVQNLERRTTELPRPQPELPAMQVRLHEPSGGGGGVVEIDGTIVQLTLPQFELMALLVARMEAEQDRPIGERGFVATGELHHLSLASTMPADSHVRQLVLRLRRILAKAGLGDLIESRYGVGYRLRATARR